MKPARAYLGSAAFFIAAPGLVAGIIPWMITRWRLEPAPYLAIALGALLVLAGLLVLIDCFWRFAREGQGTPAPAAPPQKLIVTGFYRHVRNPMYLAVMALIMGQLLIFQHAALVAYGVALWCAFQLFIVYYEEPKLRSAYAESYQAYAAHVPRWLPRLKPWRG